MFIVYLRTPSWNAGLIDKGVLTTISQWRAKYSRCNKNSKGYFTRLDLGGKHISTGYLVVSTMFTCSPLWEDCHFRHICLPSFKAPNSALVMTAEKESHGAGVASEPGAGFTMQRRRRMNAFSRGPAPRNHHQTQQRFLYVGIREYLRWCVVVLFSERVETCWNKMKQKHLFFLGWKAAGCALCLLILLLLNRELVMDKLLYQLVR